MWYRGSGELDFILVYRNSGEWTLRSWMEKRFVCAQISVPLAALQCSCLSVRFLYLQQLSRSSSPLQR